MQTITILKEGISILTTDGGIVFSRKRHENTHLVAGFIIDV